MRFDDFKSIGLYCFLQMMSDVIRVMRVDLNTLLGPSTSPARRNVLHFRTEKWKLITSRYLSLCSLLRMPISRY